ncbi:hypothetical protein DSUL_150063 [Desulfovibrionales bacterium]
MLQKAICQTVVGMVCELNQKPVYTIHELLLDKEFVPCKCYCMGGPSLAFRDFLIKELGYDVEVPTHYEVANAIGAALTDSTAELELFADTKKKKAICSSSRGGA